MTVRADQHLGVPSPAGAASASGGAAFEEAGPFLERLEGLGPSGVGGLARADVAALDALAFWCARGGGAHELAIGEGLDLLARTGGDVRLGYSGVGDLARERLGLAAHQARRLRRTAEALRARPLLRDAVLSGEVSARKAEVVIPVALGAEEAYWVERARVDTVRRLEVAVGSPEHAEEDWHRIRVGLPREQIEVLDAALVVAKVVVGPTAPVWKRLWAIAAEFVSTHPVDPLEPMAPRRPPARAGGDDRSRPDALPPDVVRGAVSPEGAAGGPGGGAAVGRAAGEHSAPGVSPSDVVRGTPLAPGRAGAGGEQDAGAAPGAGAAFGVKAPVPDPYLVVERLVRLVAERAAAEEQLGRACLLVRRFGVARQLGYACFDEWCVERLGLAPSTVYQRMALERRLRELPELREALRSGRLSYEQARLVGRVATPRDVASRIEEAAGKTCLALARGVEAEERLQMWNAGELRAVVPEDVGSLLSDAIRAARLHSEGGLTPGEALVAVASHFIVTWEAEVRRLAKGADPVILRDEALCQVPGCSRAADHVHHVWFRSAGGPCEEWNKVALCAVHHLRAVHGGTVSILGRAPDGLTFILGEREVRAARARC